jgi:hypothetical protein
LKPPRLTAFPAPELGEEQRLAFDLAGTVGLPSPFPAVGRVFVIRTPKKTEPGEKDDHGPRFFIKIVQTISPKHIATTFLQTEDVRAVRCPPESGPVTDLATWTFLNIDDVRALIKAAIKELSKAEHVAACSFEVQLFNQAVVYVPESAPVLSRAEFALVAAVAAEQVPILLCPHHEPPRPFACPPR